MHPRRVSGLLRELALLTSIDFMNGKHAWHCLEEETRNPRLTWDMVSFCVWHLSSLWHSFTGCPVNWVRSLNMKAWRPKKQKTIPTATLNNSFLEASKFSNNTARGLLAVRRQAALSYTFKNGEESSKSAFWSGCKHFSPFSNILLSSVCEATCSTSTQADTLQVFQGKWQEEGTHDKKPERILNQNNGGHSSYGVSFFSLGKFPAFHSLSYVCVYPNKLCSEALHAATFPRTTIPGDSFAV